MDAEPSSGWDRFQGRALGLPLTIAVGAACVAILACWVPQYLTWPWWIDHDHFATFAMSWDEGKRLPYRDLPSFQFPGEYYLFWAVGKAFGWGRTTPLYAIDAAALGVLGVVAAWVSRRRSGRMLPGLMGFLAFAWYYANLGFEQTAQRDWHATLLFVMALLMAEAGPGWKGKIGSALAAAMALAIRPQLGLLLPAMALALDEGSRPAGGRWTRTLRAWISWGVTLAAGLALAFAPLYLGGIWGDFLHGLRYATPGAGYSSLTTASFGVRFWGQFDGHWALFLVPLANLALAGFLVPTRRRMVATWALAALGAFFYKPSSPVPHLYLAHNLALVWSVNLAILAGLIAEARRPIAPLRLPLILSLLALASPGWPSHADPLRALQAWPSLAGGEMPRQQPDYLGFWRPYAWSDYRAMIGHLRRTTGPGTPVANALAKFPAINGVVGRPSPMPEECLSWFAYWDTPEMRAEYARGLAGAPSGVVVWAPEERGGGILPEALAATIAAHYEFEARFGIIEVWRRKAPRSR